jgi:hypothetical protein
LSAFYFWMKRLMDSLEDKSVENQKILYRADLHWAILLGPVLLIGLGGLLRDSKGSQSIVVLVFGLVWGLCSYVSLRQSKITLTADRLFIRVGFPLKTVCTLPLDEITLIRYYQPALGAMLNFGKIILVHGGTKKNSFRFVARPAELVNQIQGVMISRHKDKP